MTGKTGHEGALFVRNRPAPPRLAVTHYERSLTLDRRATGCPGPPGPASLTVR
ncbi:hypothetical protein [Streptomyces sp. NPDC051567]|uniref:hypothetical protein n=1 Tax=Streptomyces sp. NPDC051567 TaxID=3365660 RepID=UPI0037B4D9D7